MQIRVVRQGNQEGAPNFTVTQLVVFQRGGRNTQQICKLRTAQTDRFTDLTDLLANSDDISIHNVPYSV